MDSNPIVNIHLHRLIDDQWRKELLAFDEISVPEKELPDPEADANDPYLSLNQLDSKWTELALSNILKDPLPPPPRF